MYGVDYILPPDEDRFPRENVHLAKAEENPLGAWAWRCTIKDKNVNEGILKGKTLAIKDCVAIKGVPFLLGTEMFKDYIPVGDTCLPRSPESRVVFQ